MKLSKFMLEMCMTLYQCRKHGYRLMYPTKAQWRTFKSLQSKGLVSSSGLDWWLTEKGEEVIKEEIIKRRLSPQSQATVIIPDHTPGSKRWMLRVE